MISVKNLFEKWIAGEKIFFAGKISMEGNDKSVIRRAKQKKQVRRLTGRIACFVQ
jgi:hypothetical protein